MNDQESSRPKIYKLPQTVSYETESYVSRTVLMVCLALLLIAIIPALWSYRKVQERSVSVSVSLDQSALLSPTAGGDSEALMVRDVKGDVVGQISPMPSDEAQNQVKTNSKIDPNSGKELLNIIGKY